MNASILAGFRKTMGVLRGASSVRPPPTTFDPPTVLADPEGAKPYSGSRATDFDFAFDLNEPFSIDWEQQRAAFGFDLKAASWSRLPPTGLTETAPRITAAERRGSFEGRQHARNLRRGTRWSVEDSV